MISAYGPGRKKGKRSKTKRYSEIEQDVFRLGKGEKHGVIQWNLNAQVMGDIAVNVAYIAVNVIGMLR